MANFYPLFSGRSYFAKKSHAQAEETKESLFCVSLSCNSKVSTKPKGGQDEKKSPN
jgi:hypothetical protein